MQFCGPFFRIIYATCPTDYDWLIAYTLKFLIFLFHKLIINLTKQLLVAYGT